MGMGWREGGWREGGATGSPAAPTRGRTRARREAVPRLRDPVGAAVTNLLFVNSRERARVGVTDGN